MQSPRAFLLLAAIAALAFPAALSAQVAGPTTRSACSLKIASPVNSWIIQGYDPFGQDNPIGTFDLTFENQGAAECRFYPLFRTDGETIGLRTQAGSAHIPYSLFDNYAHTDATPIGGRTTPRATQRPLVIAGHSQQLVRYTLSVPPESIPGDGLYNQRLIVEASDSSGEVMGEHQVLLGIDVLPSATLDLAGAFQRVNGMADVDLGTLSSGIVNLPLQLYVQSTRGYRLQVHSQHNGNLVLAGTDWRVPYQMVINGRAVPLTSADGYSGARRAGMQRDVLPISFAIGDVTDHRAGTYSDIVTVTVSLI
jgi:spore coat protein U-like protein